MDKTSPKRQKQTFNSDELMWKTYAHLVSDFANACLGDPQYHALQSIISRRDAMSLRQVKIEYQGDDPYKFKVYAQLRNLAKRHRFKKDLFSGADLEKSAIQKFMDVQERLKNWCYINNDLDRLYIDYMRRFIKRVLGPYVQTEHYDRCKFAKRASVGVLARDACEAARWNIRVSGSEKQIEWFTEYLNGDPTGAGWDYLCAQAQGSPPVPFELIKQRASNAVFDSIDSLAMTLVPKSYKSLRSIVPDSTIGSFISHGLGEMIRLRLKRAGYDLATLQSRHQELARLGSKFGHLTTADLSSASDCITGPLLKLILPDDWYSVLEDTRIAGFHFKGVPLQAETFAGMGIGYTFALQTLVFLAILKAGERFCRLFGEVSSREKIVTSVYGDDMIMSSSIFPTVAVYLQRFGFILNADKTFWRGQFRESCGGDYFAGVDVRPFQPEIGQAQLGFNAYVSVLYKFINGLRRRWTEHEVPCTLQFLMNEFSRLGTIPFVVPVDFPDNSGIQCCWPSADSFIQQAAVKRPVSKGHGLFQFSYLRFEPRVRKEARHGPYLWVALRGSYSRDDLPDHRLDLPGHPASALIRFLNETLIGGYTPILIWKECIPHVVIRTKIRGRTLRKTAFVTINGEGRYRVCTSVQCF